METFDEAKDKLSAFLKLNNHPSKYIWIFREDISQIGNLTFFRACTLEGDEAQVRKIYDYGVLQDLGITFSSMFYTHEYTVVYIWIPTNKNDAIYHLQGRCLKISLAVKSREESNYREIEIKNGLLWKIVKMLNQQSNANRGFIDEIPKRSTK